MCDLSNPIYHDPDKAREHLEAIRWPDGPICPHCGVIDNAVQKVSSKKGISSHQLHRNLGVTYKTAWFMTHRIRLAMESTDTTTMGSGGGIVETDQTYIGRRKGVKKAKAGHAHKMKVFALVERGGKVKSARVSGSMFDGVKKGLENVSPDAHLMTDEASLYRKVGKRSPCLNTKQEDGLDVIVWAFSAPLICMFPFPGLIPCPCTVKCPTNQAASQQLLQPSPSQRRQCAS